MEMDGISTETQVLMAVLKQDSMGLKRGPAAKAFMSGAINWKFRHKVPRACGHFAFTTIPISTCGHERLQLFFLLSPGFVLMQGHQAKCQTQIVTLSSHCRHTVVISQILIRSGLWPGSAHNRAYCELCDRIAQPIDHKKHKRSWYAMICHDMP